jgi:hypothetical protein
MGAFSARILSMNLPPHAQRLWQLWQAHRPGSIKQAEDPFEVEVERLLGTQTLDDTLDLLRVMAHETDQHDSFSELRRVAFAHTCTLLLNRADQPGVTYMGLGLALPIVGKEKALTIDADFWPQVAAHLKTHAQAFCKQDSWMDFHPLTLPLHLETCGQLKMDTWRSLFMEHVSHQPRQVLQRVTEVEQQVESQAQHIDSELVEELGERVAVLMLVVRPDQWPVAELDRWLTQLAQDASWTTQFSSADRAVLPPGPIRQAVAAALSHRLSMATTISIQDRQMQLGPSTEATFAVQDDPEHEGTAIWSSSINGLPMDPVPLSANMLMLVGPEGLKSAHQQVIREVGNLAQRMQVTDEEGAWVPAHPPRRPLLN